MPDNPTKEAFRVPLFYPYQSRLITVCPEMQTREFKDVKFQGK